MNPYTHKNNAPSPRAFDARQNNTMEMLNTLVNQPHPVQGTMQPIAESDLQGLGAVAQGQPFSLDETTTVEPFDEKGNFVRPPIEGYWLGVLERINATDPMKQGPDWRDEAIDRFKKIRQNLDLISAEIGGAK